MSQYIIHRAAFTIFDQSAKELELTLYPDEDLEEQYQHDLYMFKIEDENFYKKFYDTRSVCAIPRK